jgi:hypothetical protein
VAGIAQPELIESDAIDPAMALAKCQGDWQIVPE